MYFIWIITLDSNSKLLKRNSKSFSIFQAAKLVWAQTLLKPGPSFLPHKPSFIQPILVQSGPPLLPVQVAQVAHFSLLAQSRSAPSSPSSGRTPELPLPWPAKPHCAPQWEALPCSVVEEAKCHLCLLRSPHQATPERLPSLSFSVSKWLVLKTHHRPLLFLPRPLTSLPRPI
jgi:hypothetical protein